VDAASHRQQYGLPGRSRLSLRGVSPIPAACDEMAQWTQRWPATRLLSKVSGSGRRKTPSADQELDTGVPNDLRVRP